MGLIDADALIKEACAEGAYGYVDAKQIADAPTIDAVPVRHGRWIDKGEYAVCMECGGLSGTQYDGVEPVPLMTKFCPNCGARME